MRLVYLGAVAMALFASGATPATSRLPPGTPDANESDPGKLGWMVGSPPPAERTLRLEDGSFFRFPALRWTVAHFRELMPTLNVSRGLGPPVPLPRAPRPDLGNVRFTPLGATQPMSWDESLQATYTDGVVVLHRGRIVYERYFGALTEYGQHAAMSMTKSVTGTLGAMLIAEGTLDQNKRVAEYVPELANSAFGDATVRQVLDMTTALDFDEDYSDPKSDILAHGFAGNPLPKPADYRGPRSYYESLQTVRKQGEHGQAFGYKTVNTDALGWIIARASGRNLAELLSERIWRRLGAEQDAYFTLDSVGTPFAGGGLNTGLRDLARFGEMMRNDGRFNGVQIIPRAAVRSLRAGGDRAAFAKGGFEQLSGWSYRDMWWITHNPDGAFTGRGVHGQALYIDPKAEMVIARYASYPVASNAANDPISLPAFEALAAHLSRQPR